MAAQYSVVCVILLSVTITSATIWEKFTLQPACSRDFAVERAEARIDATGSITAADGSTIPYSVSGVVKFTATNPFVTRIQVTFTGVRPFLADSPDFAMHVHQYGLTYPDCLATGDHYNPCNKEHSDEPRTKERHVGDVIKTTIPDDSDTVTIDVKDYQVKLSGSLSVLGRGVVIHAGISQARIGCATIAVSAN